MISDVKNTSQHLSLVILHITIVRLLSFPFFERRRHLDTNLGSDLVVEFGVELLISHVDGVDVLPEWFEITTSEEVLNTVVCEEKVYYFLGLSQK